MKIIIFSKSTWNIYNFRKNLLIKMIKNNWKVYILASLDNSSENLKSIGCNVIPININNKKINPLIDFILLFKIFKIYNIVKPDVTCNFNIKPVIYGSLICRFLKIPSINMITGLGTAFISSKWITIVVKFLYYFSLRKTKIVFFQNKDDKKIFLENNLVPEISANLIPGSGIDLSYFYKVNYPENNNIHFLLIARMLWDKGIKEYIEAAKFIKKKYSNITFQLLGPIEEEIKSEISKKQISLWQTEGVINYLGFIDDVRPSIKNCHCVVLPSYREGTPKSLLEAAAMCRPIITTNTVGCKEVVEDSYNGYLCKSRDALSLIKSIEKFLSLSLNEKKIMGLNGRKKIEKEFDETIVINRYFKEISTIKKQ